MSEIDREVDQSRPRHLPYREWYSSSARLRLLSKAAERRALDQYDDYVSKIVPPKV